MAFTVGQKVARVGVKTSYDKAYGFDEWPACIGVGGIYTIRDVDTRAADFGWPIVLRFEEFCAELCDLTDIGLGSWEPGFPGDCFRPIVERETDISIFTEMLRQEEHHGLV